MFPSTVFCAGGSYGELGELRIPWRRQEVVGWPELAGTELAAAAGIG
jgi:hypothetical protein